MEKKMENEMETGTIHRGLQGLGLPKIGGTISGCPHNKHCSIYWGPPILESYHISR